MWDSRGPTSQPSSRITSVAGTMRSVESLLEELRERLNGPVEWEIKRGSVEILVGEIQVETNKGDGDASHVAEDVFRQRDSDAGGTEDRRRPRQEAADGSETAAERMWRSGLASPSATSVVVLLIARSIRSLATSTFAAANAPGFFNGHIPGPMVNQSLKRVPREKKSTPQNPSAPAPSTDCPQS